MPWSLKFDDPIPTDGKPIVTLKHAADYILKLSKREAKEPHWQLAMKQLIDAAEDRDFVMHARIAMLKALNFGKPRPEVTRRKRVRVMTILK